MGVYNKECFPQRVDKMDQGMYYHACVSRASELAHGGRVDSTAVGSEVEMPARTPTNCLGGECTCHMYHASMFAKTV